MSLCTCANDFRQKILIHYKYEDQPRITYHEKGDWIDLYAVEDVYFKEGDFKLIDLGVIIKLPSGYEAHIAPRSSTFKTWGILQTNSVGVVDESYCGPEDWWRFPALAMKETVVRKGDKICQFRIMRKMDKPNIIEVDSAVDRVSRGGFGSTGKNNKKIN